MIPHYPSPEVEVALGVIGVGWNYIRAKKIVAINLIVA